MSTPTSEFLNSLALPTVPRSVGRPLRDVRLEHLAGTSLALEIMSQGVMDYTGDDDNPRPVRPRSLYGLKKWIADYFSLARYRGALPDDTLYFAFCNDRIEMPLDEAVSVPPEDLWWLAASGDTLLLSDQRTHHYTSVYHVDPDAGRIYLVDPWPDRIFLKKGLNTRDVEAAIEPLDHEESAGRSVKLVSITHTEFLRVIVGIITIDTPELIEHYLTQHPALCARFEIQLAFGLALMDAEKYVMARSAVICFRDALRLAEASQTPERIAYTASRLYVALVAAIYHQRWLGDMLATKPFEDELRHLTVSHSEDQLLAGTHATELCSLSNAAGISADYMTAIRFLDIAIARFPNEEEPRRLRAKIRIMREDYQGALDDVAQALDHNTARIRVLEECRDAWHPDDRYSRSDDENRIAGLKERRFDELDMRTTALLGLKNVAEAHCAAKDLIAYAPDKSSGYRKLAAAEHLFGNEAASMEYLQQALEREHDPRMRTQIEALLMVEQDMAQPTHSPIKNRKEVS